MTNKISIEKAIECNKNLRAYMEICDKNSPCKFCEENYIALDMGIEALEQENRVIEMRDATPEERESIGKYINNISKPTGVSFKDCISRQDAINKMQELEDEDIKAYGCEIPEGFDGKRAIRALKTLQPAKSKTGHWIHGRCSECGKDGLLESTGEYVCNTFVYRVARSKYCPNCGVRMVESEDENDE